MCLVNNPFRCNSQVVKGSRRNRLDSCCAMSPHVSNMAPSLTKTFMHKRVALYARSSRHLVNALEEFQALGIDFVSLSESIDTSTPMGRMVFTVIGAVAELERSLIQERVVMGLNRARKGGTRLGRPRVPVDAAEVTRLRVQGRTWAEISLILSISRGAAQRAGSAMTA